MKTVMYVGVTPRPNVFGVWQPRQMEEVPDHVASELLALPCFQLVEGVDAECIKEAGAEGTLVAKRIMALKAEIKTYRDTNIELCEEIDKLKDEIANFHNIAANMSPSAQELPSVPSATGKPDKEDDETDEAEDDIEGEEN